MGALQDSIRKCVSAAVKRSRGTTFEIDSRIAPASALAVSGRRAIEGVRGFVGGLQLKKCGQPLFLGSNVKFYHPRMISIGTGCNIGENTLLDGLSRDGLVLGNNVTLDRFVTVKATGTLRNLGIGVRIGSNSSLGAFSYVGAAGGVYIGDNVMMGPFVGIYAENHLFDDMEVELIRDQGVSRRGITISDNCWIGSSAIVLDGVTIGRGCVVGAGSVVVDDVEADMVVAGVPARTIRKRGKQRVE